MDISGFLKKFFYKNNNLNINKSNNNISLQLLIAEILRNNYIAKLITDMELFFKDKKRLPKEQFKKFISKHTFNKELENLNFIQKNEEITFDNIYTNRKIYYILNETENLIKLKITDKLFNLDISQKYKEKIIDIVNEIFNKEEIEYFDKNYIIKLINNFEKNIDMYLNKKLILQENNILNIIRKHKKQDIYIVLKNIDFFKDIYSNKTIFEKISNIQKLVKKRKQNLNIKYNY